MAKAKQLPSGNWRCRAAFTDEDGVQHIESFTAPTKRKAEALALAWQEGMLEKKKNRTKQPLGHAIDAYIESCRCAGLSPSTIRSYKSSREKAFDLLINRPIDRITTRDLQAWINVRAKAVVPKTLKNNLALLSAVFKAEDVKLDMDALKVPKVRRQEMAIPSDAQVSILLQETYDCDDMYLAIAFAALMGLRRSEICALKWTDIVTENNVAYLDVSKALVLDEHATHVEKTPKTDAGNRLLPIPSALHVELKRRRGLRSTIISLSPNAITERYQRLTERLGVPPRFHNLRHYHASVMLREGVPEKYIVADMGHSSFDMVRRVYGHVMQEKRSLISTAMDMHASSVLNIDTNIDTASENA